MKASFILVLFFVSSCKNFAGRMGEIKHTCISTFYMIPHSFHIDVCSFIVYKWPSKRTHRYVQNITAFQMTEVQL